MSKPKAEFIQSLLDECDQYQQTVNGLHAFAESCVWDHRSKATRTGARFSIPRRMDALDETGEEVVVRKVTPDGVVQVSENYGVVAEMKLHFPKQKQNEPFDQARSYSVPLRGWWTADETLGEHDVVLLTGIPSATRAADAYTAWVDEGNKMKRPFAIVEFGFIRTAQEWFWLRKVAGSLSDADHDASLREGKHLPSSLMTAIIGRAKFMETEPPPLLMLFIVYTYALPVLLKPSDFEIGPRGKVPLVKASVDDVTSLLALLFTTGPSEPRTFKVPRTAWVARSLRTMVDLGLATSPAPGSNRYHIPLRKPGKKDVFRYFAEKLYAREMKAERTKARDQPDLFE